MIRRQMREMNPEHDYLGSKLPAPLLPALDSPWIQSEIERVMKEKASKDTEMTETDGSYGCPVADPSNITVANYKKALD